MLHWHWCRRKIFEKSCSWDYQPVASPISSGHSHGMVALNCPKWLIPWVGQFRGCCMLYFVSRSSHLFCAVFYGCCARMTRPFQQPSSCSSSQSCIPSLCFSISVAWFVHMRSLQLSHLQCHFWEDMKVNCTGSLSCSSRLVLTWTGLLFRDKPGMREADDCENDALHHACNPYCDYGEWVPLLGHVACEIVSTGIPDFIAAAVLWVQKSNTVETRYNVHAYNV